MNFRYSLGVSLFFSLSAFAQTPAALAELAKKLEGTIFVKPHRETVDGVLTGCGLEFTVLKRDFATKQGAPVKVVGSFYLRPNKNTGLAYVLKLGLYDGFSAEDAIAPNNAFISAPNGKIPVKAIRVAADNPGFALFVGGLDDAVTDAYAAIVEKKSLVVGFNRRPGQQDVTVLIDLSITDTQFNEAGDVIRQRSGESVNVFAACSGDLIKIGKQSVR